MSSAFPAPSRCRRRPTPPPTPSERALADLDVVRGFAETRHKAGSWDKERRAIARIEATRLGLDTPLHRHQPQSRLGRMAV